MANVTLGYNAAGNALDFTDIPTLKADGGVNAFDTIQVYYYNAVKSTLWPDTFGIMSTKVLHVHGMVPGLFMIGKQSHGYSVTGDQSGNGEQIVIQDINFRITKNNAVTNGIYWNNTGADGPGIKLSRVYVSGGSNNVQLTNDPFNLDFVIATFAYGYGIYTRYAGVGSTIDFCVSIGNERGVYLRDVSGDMTARNTISVENDTADWLTPGASTGNNNVDSDGTAADGNWSSGANNLTNRTLAQIKFGYDNTSVNFVDDFRLKSDSPLIGQGIAVPGITTDFDGETLLDPPQIGSNIGTVYVAANNVIKSAGGNWNDDNLTDQIDFTANVRDTVAGGLGWTGGYDPVTTQQDAPAITLVTPASTQLTVSLTPATGEEAVPMYLLYRIVEGEQPWSAESESWKRTGAGDVVITGLSNMLQYEVIGYHKSGALIGAWAKPRYGTPFDVEDTVIRDTMAEAALVVCQTYPGMQFTLTNKDEDPIELWAAPHPKTGITGISTGSTDIETITLTVPRQTGFPPQVFYPGATITIHSLKYMLQDWACDNGDLFNCSAVVLNAWRYRTQHVEIGTQ